jgi:hypothetical protein
MTVVSKLFNLINMKISRPLALMLERLVYNLKDVW